MIPFGPIVYYVKLPLCSMIPLSPWYILSHGLFIEWLLLPYDPCCPYNPFFPMISHALWSLTTPCSPYAPFWPIIPLVHCISMISFAPWFLFPLAYLMERCGSILIPREGKAFWTHQLRHHRHCTIINHHYRCFFVVVEIRRMELKEFEPFLIACSVQRFSKPIKTRLILERITLNFLRH